MRQTLRSKSSRKIVSPRLVRFRTETGSVYEVDCAAATWRRLSLMPRSGQLRSETGSLLRLPEVELGESVVLVGPPWRAGLGERVVITTPVVMVEVNPA